MADIKALINRNNVEGHACRDCKNRHERCHSTCELYKANKEKALKEKKAIYKQRMTEESINAYMKKSIAKSRDGEKKKR